MVMVVRPDLSGGRKDVACQAEAAPIAGGAPEAHEAGGAAATAEEHDASLSEDLKTYDPQNPLVYVEIVEAKHQAADAVIKMIALMREELGRFPTSLPSSWTVHRLHSDKGSELLPKALDTYCLEKDIRRTTAQG